MKHYIKTWSYDREVQVFERIYNFCQKTRQSPNVRFRKEINSCENTNACNINGDMFLVFILTIEENINH